MKSVLFEALARAEELLGRLPGFEGLWQHLRSCMRIFLRARLEEGFLCPKLQPQCVLSLREGGQLKRACLALLEVKAVRQPEKCVDDEEQQDDGGRSWSKVVVSHLLLCARAMEPQSDTVDESWGGAPAWAIHRRCAALYACALCLDLRRIFMGDQQHSGIVPGIAAAPSTATGVSNMDTSSVRCLLTFTGKKICERMCRETREIPSSVLLSEVSAAKSSSSSKSHYSGANTSRGCFWDALEEHFFALEDGASGTTTGIPGT
jgi:hypothetical protein